jgi:hypothetical protein
MRCLCRCKFPALFPSNHFPRTVVFQLSSIACDKLKLQHLLSVSCSNNRRLNFHSRRPATQNKRRQSQMSQGRGYYDPYEDGPPPHQNHQNGPRLTSVQPVIPSGHPGNYGAPNGQGTHLRYSMPPEPHKHTHASWLVSDLTK